MVRVLAVASEAELRLCVSHWDNWELFGTILFNQNPALNKFTQFALIKY